MATPTGITQIGKPGGLVEPGIVKYGIMDWLPTAAKVAGSAAKYYIDYKDQKRRNELADRAYQDYAAEVAEAQKEAQAAIDINLTPMNVSNIPTTKADVSDFTAVAARGGLMNLPTKQRKRYAYGPNPEDIPTMDDMSPPFNPKEEGVVIGEQVFYDTGRGDRSNAMQIWNQMSTPDKSIHDFDFEIFFMDGGWRDMIKSEVEVEGDTRTASAVDPMDALNDMAMQVFGKALHELNEEEHQILIDMANDQAAAPSANGIMQVAKGGRIGFADGNGGTHPLAPELEALTLKSFRQQLSPKEVERMDYLIDATGSLDEYKAQGGRIGYQEGTHPLDGVAMQMFGMTFENLNPLQQIVVTQSQDQAKGPQEPEELEGMTPETHPSWFSNGELQHMLAYGGRIKKDNGGIMNLGGMEKDYRTTGGFVPIGEYEKKDDVPARLSKNEFVMTADAVRAAGGGSINKGAQRMYNTMKHLEASPGSKRMTA